MNDIVTAGPAASAAAAPVLTNNPAPIMAPIPKAIRLLAPSVRFKPDSLSEVCASKPSVDFILHKLVVQLIRFYNFRIGKIGI
jgi:hypothetical protein